MSLRVQTSIDTDKSTVVLIARPSVFTSALRAAIESVHLQVQIINPKELSKALVRQEVRSLFSHSYVCVWVDIPIFVPQKEKEKEDLQTVEVLRSVLHIPLHFISFDTSYKRKNGRAGELPTNASQILLKNVLNTIQTVRSFEYLHVMYPYEGGISVVSRFILEKIQQGKRFPFLGQCTPLWYADVVSHIVESLYDLNGNGGSFTGSQMMSLESFESQLRRSSHLRSVSGPGIDFPFEFPDAQPIGKTPFAIMEDELSLLLSEPNPVMKDTQVAAKIFVQQKTRKSKQVKKKKRLFKILGTFVLSIFLLYAAAAIGFFLLIADIRSTISDRATRPDTLEWSSEDVSSIFRKTSVLHLMSTITPLPYRLVGMELPKEGVIEGLQSVSQLLQGMQQYHEGNDLFIQFLVQSGQASPQKSITGQQVLSRFDESYKSLSAIQAEITSGNPIFDSLFGIDGLSVQLQNSIGLLRESITQEKALASLSDTLLTKPGKSTVLLVAMDSTVARPLFGTPTEVVILSLDQGKLVKTQLFSVDQLDEMLKGKVETPNEIQMLGGSTAWHLSDGAWSPDGPTASRQITWFINKQIHEDADVVIFLEAPVIAKLQTTLASKVNENSSILGTQTTRVGEGSLSELLYTNSNVDFRQSLTYFIEALNSSQAVLFSKDAGNAKIAKALAWDASVRTPTCPPQFLVDRDCAVITRYVAEYDLEMKSENQRSIDKLNQVHKMFLSRDGIVHTDSILYPESPSRAQKIIKFFIDEDASLTAIALNGQIVSLEDSRISKEFGKTTITLPVTLQETKETSLSISYTTPAIHPDKSSVAFFAQKQAGKESEPFSLEVSYSRNFIPEIIAPKGEVGKSGVSFSTTMDTSKIFALGF